MSPWRNSTRARTCLGSRSSFASRSFSIAREIDAEHLRAGARHGQRDAAVADAVLEDAPLFARETDVEVDVVASILVRLRVVRGVEVMRERALVSRSPELGDVVRKLRGAEFVFVFVSHARSRAQPIRAPRARSR